ncbi:MAG: winged helix-turn-helix domain-containing protein [Caldilineaceae bacterium]
MVAETTETGETARVNERFVFDDLIIDLDRHEVKVNGATVHLKPKEYELLVFLARNRGIVLSRDLILERVWGWDYDGGSRTVDVHVRWLRKRSSRSQPSPIES